MSVSELFITIAIVLVVGVIAIGIHRLMFKKSIVFRLIAVMTFPLISSIIIAVTVGTLGFLNFIWAAPTIVVIITVAFEVIAKMLQKPLKEMMNAINSLSAGNVDVTYNEKFQKGEHELAIVMRQMNLLTKELKNIASFATQVGKGNLNVEYTLLSETDSLGQSMLDMRANLQQAEAEKEERRQEDERRNWVTHGIAKFADLLRSNNDNIEELSNSIISNLVKYIGANQGGIFILNDDDPQNPVLEMKACYAYERRKFLQKTIGLGEGLVGTCFLERESIYMTCLPKDYINITSGLGEDTPRALLIVPLKVNEEVYGIVEIAAFKEFEPHVREFVEKVSESIASTIGSVKINLRTNKLLVQTKFQAEEMANQEEELRQNMEEMQATQEEMFRREAELKETLEKMLAVQDAGEEKEYEMKQFYDAIFASNNVVELSSDAVITNVNQNLLNLFNADRSVFIGKHASAILGDEATGAAWSSLRQGRYYEDVQTPDTGSGKKMQIRQKFMPICNRQGVLLRVLLLVFPENA